MILSRYRESFVENAVPHIHLIYKDYVGEFAEKSTIIGQAVAQLIKTLRYKPEGPGFDCRSQWPQRLRRRPVAASFLGLRVRIPPRACIFCDVCFTVKEKGTSQDNQEK